MATTGNDRVQRPTGRDMARVPEGRDNHPETDTEDSVADDFDDEVEESKDNRPAPGNGSQRAAAPARPSGTAEGAFEIYRPAQGGRVRWGTAALAGLLVVWGAYFMYDRLTVLGNTGVSQAIKYGIPLLMAVVGGFYALKLVTRNRRSVDFLIATEGEMKKVNWSTQKEVVGSTIVVIVVMVFMAILLFVVDAILLKFFGLIGVLRLTPGS